MQKREEELKKGKNEKSLKGKKKIYKKLSKNLIYYRHCSRAIWKLFYQFWAHVISELKLNIFVWKKNLNFW